MMASVETYLRRGQRRLHRLLMEHRLQVLLRLSAAALGGMGLSAAALGGMPQPVAMGLICALGGWLCLPAALGSLAGFRLFWETAGLQGTVWSLGGCFLALFSAAGKDREDTPLWTALLSGVLVAVSGLTFQMLGWEDTPIRIYLIRIFVSMFSAALFQEALRNCSGITGWLLGAVATWSLAQAVILPGLSLGYVAGGLLAVGGSFPASVLAGLGLDLARITPVPMTAVLCLSYFLRTVPLRLRWLRYAAPAAACLGVLALWGLEDISPIPGLLLGGGLGVLLPQPREERPVGRTGLAQVRLELGAGVLLHTRQLLLDTAMPQVDREGILERVRLSACGSCGCRKSCQEQHLLQLRHFQDPMSFTCRKSGRVRSELCRGRDQLKYLQQDRARREEYRQAVAQQYLFLAQYLRTLADRLPGRVPRGKASYAVEVSARCRGRQIPTGDRCSAFPGTGCRYYVMLCDGMGTGAGAAWEGETAAELLRRMLTAGFPAEYALRSLNSLLVLRGQAGAVSVDLAELRLDKGVAALYKWGAAPSFLLYRGKGKKIGTAMPPPGISVGGHGESVARLSLRRGEVLVLISDGVEGEEGLRRTDLSPEMPPGELAQLLLEHSAGGQDDATAVVIRLRLADPVT